MADDPKRSIRGETAAGEAMRVGADLRVAREALNLSIEDVAGSLKIRRVYLDAIEEGRVRDLPAPAYAVGFVRTYARALGLDEAALVRRFRDGAAGAANRRADLVFPEPVPERGVPAGAVILLGAVLAVGGYVGWYQWSGRQARTADAIPPLPPRIEAALPAPTPPQRDPVIVPSPPAPGGVAVQAPPAAPTPPAGVATFAPSGASGTSPAVTAADRGTAGAIVPPQKPDEGRISIRARSDAWVQLRERANGPVIVNRTLRTGETLNVPKVGMLLATGNAAALQILVDGQPVAGFAPGNAVRRDVPLDADRLKLAAIPAPPRPPAAPRQAEPPPPAQ